MNIEIDLEAIAIDLNTLSVNSLILMWYTRNEQIAKYLTADHSVFQYSNANDMRVTQDFNSFGKIIAHAQCSVDEKKKIYIYFVCTT
jgi:hypothetical protein